MRALRRARGLTGEELAALAGLSLRTIYAAEVDDVHPQRATRRVLALALQCEVDEIFPSNESSPAGKPSSTKVQGDGPHEPI